MHRTGLPSLRSCGVRRWIRRRQQHISRRWTVLEILQRYRTVLDVLIAATALIFLLLLSSCSTAPQMPPEVKLPPPPPSLQKPLPPIPRPPNEAGKNGA